MLMHAELFFLNHGSRQRPRFWRQKEEFPQEVITNPADASNHNAATNRQAADANYYSNHYAATMRLPHFPSNHPISDVSRQRLAVARRGLAVTAVALLAALAEAARWRRRNHYAAK